MVKEVLPSCSVCGAQVADNVEPEIAKEGIIKQGKYVNNVWICNECLNKKQNILKKFIFTIDKKTVETRGSIIQSKTNIIIFY